MKSLLESESFNRYWQLQLGQFHERELLQGFIQQDFMKYNHNSGQQNPQIRSIPHQFMDIVDKIRSGCERKRENLEQRCQKLYLARQDSQETGSRQKKNKFLQKINKTIDQQQESATQLQSQMENLSNTLRILKGQVHYLSQKTKAYQSQQFKLVKLKQQAFRAKVNKMEMLHAEHSENTIIEASRQDFESRLKKSATIVKNSLTKIKKQYFSFLNKQKVKVVQLQKMREKQRKVHSTLVELGQYEKKLKFIHRNTSQTLYRQLFPVYQYIKMQQTGQMEPPYRKNQFRCSTTMPFYQLKQSKIPPLLIQQTIITEFRRLSSHLHHLENICNKNINQISNSSMQKSQKAPEMMVFPSSQNKALSNAKELLLIKRNIISNMKIVYAFCNLLAEIKKKSHWFMETRTCKDILSVVWTWPSECQPFECRIFDNLITDLKKVVAILLKPENKMIMIGSEVDVSEEAYSSNFFKKAMGETQMFKSNKKPKQSINLDNSVVSVTKDLTPKEPNIKKTRASSINRLEMRSFFNRQYINTTKKTLKFSRSMNVSPATHTPNSDSRRIDMQKRDQSAYGAYVYMFRRNQELQQSKLKLSKKMSKYDKAQPTHRSISLQ